MGLKSLEFPRHSLSACDGKRYTGVVRSKRKSEVGADPCHQANQGESPTGARVLFTRGTDASSGKRELKRLQSEDEKSQVRKESHSLSFIFRGSEKVKAIGRPQKRGMEGLG